MTRIVEYFTSAQLEGVADLPFPAFIDELIETFPASLVVLTVRKDVHRWAKSSATQLNRYRAHTDLIRSSTYSLPVFNDHLYTRSYVRHALHVVRVTPCDRLVVLDILSGEGWAKLCSVQRPRRVQVYLAQGHKCRTFCPGWISLTPHAYAHESNVLSQVPCWEDRRCRRSHVASAVRFRYVANTSVLQTMHGGKCSLPSTTIPT